MRAKRLGGKNNERFIRQVAKNVSKLSGLKPDVFRYVLKLLYLGSMHTIACDCRDKSEHPNIFEIEVPYLGLLTFEVKRNKITITDAKFEDEFTKDFLAAIKTGDSPLTKEIDKKFIEEVRKKYRELL
jgi:hypothetical protein